MNLTTDKRRESGFTLIELMMVVAIIGLIFAIAAPVYSRILDNANRKALAADTKHIYDAFRRYYIDHSKFPSSDGEFSMTTLEPLVEEGHLGPGPARSYLERMVDNRIMGYITPNVTSEDSDLWFGAIPKYDPDEVVYIFYTTALIADYGALDGVYFYRDGELIPVDQVVD